MATLNETAIVLKYLSDVYGKKLGMDQVKAYHRTLAEFPRLKLVDAATMWVGQSKWYPAPAELTRTASGIGKPYPEGVDEQAWWYTFSNGISINDFTDEDVAKVYALAGESVVEPVSIPAEYIGDIH